MSNTKFYVTETRFFYQDDDANCDRDTIAISTEPAREMASREVCIEGLCVSTGSYSLYAHGEYETEEQARAAIASKFGEVRELNSYDNPDEFDEADVAVFRPGKYDKWSLDDSEAWIYESAINDVKPTDTDEDLKKYLAGYEASAHAEIGATLHPGTLDFLRELRDEMKEGGGEASNG